MIRIFKLVLLLVVSQVAFGQAPSNYTNINGRYRWIAGMFDSTFHIPKGTTNSLRVGGSTNAGALFYNTTDSTVYTYTGTQWIKLRGVVIDTTSLSNRINLKLNISDTAAMLAPYLRNVDTASLSNRINLKLNISDTATMLGNYLNNVGYGLIRSGQVVRADSATLASYFLRRKDSLTTTNPLGYVTRTILADTAAAIRSSATSGFVPYTGATQNVNLGQFGLTTKFVQFDTSSQAVTDRRLQWSNDEGTLQFGMTNGATITQRIGLEQFARVKNVDATQINKGEAVYIFGASGDRASVKKADNRQDATSSKTLGVAAEDIPVNDVGLVGTFGVVSNLNLNAYTAGDILYLDSIPGGLTKNKPQAPYHLVFIGVVERANSGNGLLFVNPQNGYELEELHNVRITSPVRNNALLVYDSTRSLWIDTTIAQAGLAVTQVNTNSGSGITGGPITTVGTIAADTLVLSTRAWRQKGIDSVQGNLTAGLALKLNISDTANMLNPYLRKVDTASLSNRINTKLNISDTSTMLGNYVNNVGYGLSKVSQVVSADSATLASYFLRRKDSLTATNLLGYVTGKILADTAAAVRAAAGGGSIGGSGTTNTIAMFTGSTNIGNSIITQSTTLGNSAIISGNLNVTMADSASSLVGGLDIGNGDFGTKENARLTFYGRTYGLSAGTATNGDFIYSRIANQTGKLEWKDRIAGTLATRFSVANGKFNINNVPNATVDTDKFMVLDGDTIKYRTGAEVLSDIGGAASSSISGTTNRLAKFTASGTIGNSSIADSSSSVAMIITSGGNVELRSGNPLLVYNTANTRSGSFVTTADGTELSSFNGSGEPLLLKAPDTNGNIRFITNGTNSTGERMRITSGGLIGINTTTIGSRLQVNGNAAIGYSASTAAPTNGLKVAGVIDFAGDTRYAVSRIYNSSTGDMFGMEQVPFTITGSEAALRLFTTSVSGEIYLGKYTSATAFTPFISINNSGLTFFGNGLVNSSPSTGIISATGGTGSNIAGAEFRIRGGASTGSGAGGPITFYTSAAGSAGTSTNAATEVGRFTSSGLSVQGRAAIKPGSSTIFADRLFEISGTAGTTGATQYAFVQNPTFGTPTTIYSWYNSLIVTSATTSYGLYYETELGTITNKWGLYFVGGTNNYLAGNLGLGTTTIGSKLQVNGNAAIGYSASTAAPTNGLAVSGNVGIGTTSPATLLHVLATNGELVRIEGTSTGSNTNFYSAKNGSGDLMHLGIANAGYSNSAYPVIIARGSYLYSPRDLGIITEAYPIMFQTNGSERMRITSGGNVGIGTTNPTQLLEVNGNILVAQSAGNYPRFISTVGAKSWEIGYRSGTTNYEIREDGTTRMVIANGGNVGIGTTSPNSTLHTNGSVAAKYVSKTATYTLDATDYTVVFNVSSAVTANLPDATTCTGRIYVIKVNNTTNTDAVTIDPNGAQTIDGNATYTIQCQYGIMIQSDGANWRIIADFGAGLNCL